MEDLGDSIDNPDRYLSAVHAVVYVRVAMARGQGVRCTGTVLVGAPSTELARHAGRTGADLMILTAAAQDTLGANLGGQPFVCQALPVGNW